MRTGDWYQDDRLTLTTAIKQQNDHADEIRKAQEAYAEGESLRNREEAKQYSTLDLLNAAFSKENPITSELQLAKDMLGTNNEPEEGYDVFSDLGDYGAFANQFIGVRNPRRAAAIKNSIDRQREDNKILRVHGAGGAVAAVAAGIGDPLTLASFLSPATAGARIAGGVGKLAAPSAIKEAGKAAVVGGGMMATSEVALHASQSMRTMEESQVNVAAGALLNGILGGVVTRADPNYKKIKAEVEARLNDAPSSPEMTSVIDVLDSQGKGIGAEQTSVVIGDTSSPAATGAKLKRNKLFEGRYNPLAMMVRLTPQGRLLTSPEKATRALTQELTDVSGAVYGDYKPTSVESMVRLGQARTDELNIEYKNLQAESNVDMDTFNTEVNNFLRYNQEPQTPQALVAAKKTRKLVDDIWQEAIDAGLEGTYTTKIVDGNEVRVPVSIDDAPEYFTRVYDQKLMRENPQQFIDTTITAMKKRNAKDTNKVMMEASDFAKANMAEQTRVAKIIEQQNPHKAELTFTKTEATKRLQSLNMQRKNRVKANKPTDNIDKQIAAMKAKREAATKQLDELAEAKKVRADFNAKLKAIEAKIPAPVDDLGYQAAASDLYDKIINLKAGDNNGSVTSSAIKGRTLRVDDADVDAFLVKDILTLTDSYNRTVGNKAKMAKRAGDGDYMWTEQIATVENLHAAKAQALAMKGDKKGAAKAYKLGRREANDIKRIRDRLLGLDQQPSYNDPFSRAVVSGIRSVRNWNTSTMLGGVLLSSLPEMSRQVAQHGLKAVLKGQGKVMKDMSISLKKLPKDDLARLSSASARTINNGKWATMADAFNEPAQSGIEAASRAVSDKLMQYSFVMHFDTNMRMINAHIMNDNMTRAVKTGKLTAKDTADFKGLGFTDGDLTDVMAEIKKHGTKDADGSYNMNVDRWDSRRMVEKMEAGVLKESNRVTTSAGVADRPLFMSTELGKTVLQYRTFGLAAINRITIPLMQGDPSQIVKGIAIPAVVAAGSLMFRRALQGRDAVPEAVANDNWDDPEAVGFAMDVVNYAGWANVIPDVALTVDKAFDIGALHSTKYRNRDKWGLLFGPTAGTVSAAFTAANFQVGPDSQVRAIRKLTPFQNLFYTRRMIDEIERATATGLGGSGMYVD